MKKYISIFFLLFLCIALHAEWDPVYLNKPQNIEVLKNPNYQLMRQNVMKFLENSWCSQEKAMLLMDLVTLEKPKVCVEIGAFMGWSVIPVGVAQQLNAQGVVYAIDAWSNSVATKGMDDNDPNKAWWQSLDMTDIHNHYDHNINYWGLQNICHTIQSPSNLAIVKLPWIDFLHIDGSFTREGSCEDVLLYLPKVKVGGYILFTNIDWMVQEKAPRMKAFSLLLNSCEIVTDIDNRSTFLLRKLYE